MWEIKIGYRRKVRKDYRKLESKIEKDIKIKI